MNAQEALAGLVLCACELLKASQGISDTEETEEAVSASFSSERFEELGGNPASAGAENTWEMPEALLAELLPKSAEGEAQEPGIRSIMQEAERAETEFLRFSAPETAKPAAGETEEPLSRLSRRMERESRRYDGTFRCY